MHNSRVIVCKLGRLGELRKVVDTNINALKDESQPQEMDSGPRHQSIAPGRSHASNLDYLSINQNFEDVLMVHDALDTRDLEGEKNKRYYNTFIKAYMHFLFQVVTLNPGQDIQKHKSTSLDHVNLNILDKKQEKFKLSTELIKYFSKMKEKRQES